jgi:hypothetical protein
MKQAVIIICIMGLIISSMPIQAIPKDPPTISKDQTYFDIKAQKERNLNETKSKYLMLVFLELGNSDFFTNLTKLDNCFDDLYLHLIVFYVGNKAFYPNEQFYFHDANATSLKTLGKHSFPSNLAIFHFYNESCYYYNYRFMITLIDVESWEIIGYENIYIEEKLYSLFYSIGLEPTSIPEEYAKFYDKPNKTIGFNLISLLLLPILFRKRKTNEQ